MIPDNVTLIVKAPNQQIADQNIECQSSWSVRQLKGHLSEVYPSKPRTEEQKIIYSGQLLDDHIILKDVLRTYESQIAHTMHLVCAPGKRMPETPKESQGESTDGLRHRNVPEMPERANEVRPEMRQNDQNHTVEMQNYMSSFANNYGRVPAYPNYNPNAQLPMPNDPALMVMMQQYMQYMQACANMWQANNEQVRTVTPDPPPQPEPVPQEEDEDGMGARDWLDHIYSASRLGILLTLVYMYGSPARFFLVLIIVGAGYLHHIGFFRDLQLIPANQQRNANGNGNANANANADANANANLPQNPNAPNQENANRNQPERPQNPPNFEQNASLLSITWMIFTSFFASLIPDPN